MSHILDDKCKITGTKIQKKTKNANSMLLSKL